MRTFLVVSLLAAAQTVRCQAGAWSQCGGTGWAGATTCIAGWTCVYSNPYYSQCLQASSTTSSKATTTTTVPVSSTTKSTISTTKTTSSVITMTLSTTKTTTTTSTTKTTTSAAASQTLIGSGPSKLVAKTPVLGWNSWNAYGGNINEAKILAAAGNMSSLGLKAAGYLYVAIDDTWSNITGRDPSTQQLRPDLNKFPNGMAYLATKIHALGLKFGIYSDAGTLTCAGFPGSLYYETIDAQTWSNWGVDLIKYDNCNVPSNWTDSYNIPSNYDWYNSNSALRYRRMTDALNTVSNPIVYSLCNWGNANVWTWGGRVGHSWRLSGDSSASWSYISSIIGTASAYAQYVDFYAHGDMDMMEIGNGDLTINEQRTHFAAWCWLKSPIVLGTDLSLLSNAQLAIITNKELLAFSQDTAFGKPATAYDTSNPPAYFSGTSSAGAHVFMINYGSATTSMTVTFSAVPQLQSKTSWTVHDMWTGTDIGTFTSSYTASIASHDNAALRFT